LPFQGARPGAWFILILIDKTVEVKSLKRALLVAAGTLSVILGVLGIFLPVLPTTPFLLLAAVCFAKSSKRFYNWLMTNRLCGEYIRNYRERKGITRRKKALTIGLLWFTIGYTALFVVSPRWGKAVLFGVAVGVTVHLTRIKTFSPESWKPGPPRCCDAAEETDQGQAKV
jgi:uncharacterized membrane protein YbaN (DUF454 family)